MKTFPKFVRSKGIRLGKAILINSPNNPTGVVYDKESLQKLGELLKRKNRELRKTLYLIGDEAYRRIVFDGIRLPILFQYYPHTLRVTSHSKDLSLAGERIGYIAVSPLCEGASEMLSAIIFANRILGFVNAPALMQRLIAPSENPKHPCTRKTGLLLTALGHSVIKWSSPGAFIFPKARRWWLAKGASAKRIRRPEVQKIFQLPTPSTKSLKILPGLELARNISFLPSAH
jgi:aspartate aminotransferase